MRRRNIAGEEGLGMWKYQKVVIRTGNGRLDIGILPRE